MAEATTGDKASIVQVERWMEDAKADREMGVYWDSTVKTIHAVLQEYASPQLLKFLDETGLGKRREFLHFVYRIGKDWKILVSQR